MNANALAQDHRVMQVATKYTEAGGAAYHFGRARRGLRSEKNRQIRALYMAAIYGSLVPPQAEYILEYGAGFGQNLLAFDAAHRFAYEPSEAALEIARSYSNITATSSIDDIPDGCFDAVFCHHALEHSRDPLADLQVIGRKMRRGAKLILVLPSEKENPYNREDPNHHLFSWTRLTIGHCLEEAGFNVERQWLQFNSLMFRLSPLRNLSVGLWITATRMAGFLTHHMTRTSARDIVTVCTNSQI